MKDIDAPSQSSAISSLAEAIVWGQLPVPNISVAIFSDDATLNETELLCGLSDLERNRAHATTDPIEKRHFIVRRCFQRVFVKSVLHWKDSLESLKIEHQLDTQPRCLDAPSLQLSFSSSGRTAMACASAHCSVGADIEKHRSIENVVKLATRFFTPEEATSIGAMPEQDQNIAFLKHWTAKEAGLKAIGKGILSGLNSFELKPNNSGYLIEHKSENDFSSSWFLHHLTILPEHIVAVVHNLEK